MSTDRYETPLAGRYASKEMQYIFSQDKKFRTWRALWIALAESEKELGLDITEDVYKRQMLSLQPKPKFSADVQRHSEEHRIHIHVLYVPVCRVHFLF